MFNVTGGELVIILLVALIVLGPDKLPDALRKVGKVYGELRRMSQGFQSEIRDALDEPMREVRDTMNTVKGGFAPDPDAPDPPTRVAATNAEPPSSGDSSAAATPATEPAPTPEPEPSATNGTAAVLDPAAEHPETERT